MPCAKHDIVRRYKLYILPLIINQCSLSHIWSYIQLSILNKSKIIKSKINDSSIWKETFAGSRIWWCKLQLLFCIAHDYMTSTVVILEVVFQWCGIWFWFIFWSSCYPTFANLQDKISLSNYKNSTIVLFSLNFELSKAWLQTQFVLINLPDKSYRVTKVSYCAISLNNKIIIIVN
jgi:hypothetical protein